MIRIALVVPHKDFIPNAATILEQHNKMYAASDSEQYVMEEVIVNSRNSDDVHIKADIVLTRGLLAEILAKLSADIPVVEISVPTADILRTIRSCIQLYDPAQIGIIAAGNMLAGISGLSDLCEAPIKTYVLSPNWNNEALVDQAVSEGCDVIIGGVNTCRYAEMIHIPNMIIQTSREAFWNALTTAKRTCMIYRREQEKSLHMQSILDISHDGIIFIDASRRITTLNLKAQTILRIDGNYLGKRISDFLLPVELKHIFSDNKEYSDEPFTINGYTLSISKTFIKTKAFISGAIINLQIVSDSHGTDDSSKKSSSGSGFIAKLHFDDIIWKSPAMAQTIHTAQRYSLTEANILLIGESGTGKEIFAQSIHNASLRKNGPFVAVNCAAIPDNLLESELLGYESGSFTGAKKSGKPGLFELAHHGTIFLDEIGEIPLALQAKLLRVIQEKEIIRIGASNVIQVDVRIVAATNKNLEKLVDEGRFREDLFYRLDVLRISIPPLRQRKEDIPLLVLDYLEKNFPGISINDGALHMLSLAPWPGNVRHLFNVCERLAVLSTDSRIDEECARMALPSAKTEHVSFALSEAELGEDECAAIRKALESCHFNRAEAAKILGMSRTTLWRKIREYQIL